jgi:alginate O-acetyltransferase complex protein AlgI
MVFSSVLFLFFFLPIVLSFYFLIPKNLKNTYLLLASLFFYFWGEQFLFLILIFSVCLDYFCALAMGEGNDTDRNSDRRRMALAFSICGNLGLLFFFKYAGFVQENGNALAGALGLGSFYIPFADDVRLPLGISFFTFQSMSYTIDVYRGIVRPTRNFLSFGCFVVLFPQLVAGPIVRYRDIAGQLMARTVRRSDLAYGIRRFVIGLGKKVLIANVVAEHADTIFGLEASQLSAPLAWYGVACYALQIYFDFSGYSDMAIGLGRMFGFRFLENFNYPYIARSMRDYWRRWHISLSTWFRDYLYIPLGGNRGSGARTSFNLVLVFFLCGLWHGASWNFVVWGLFHGFFLMVERLSTNTPPRHPRPLEHAYVLLVVLVSWVLFRCETLTQSGHMIASMFGWGTGNESLSGLFPNLKVTLAFVVGIVGSGPLVPSLKHFYRSRVEHADPSVAWVLQSSVSLASLALLSGIFLLSAMSLAAQTHNPFIYFRF